MIDPTPEDVGRKVIYRDRAAAKIEEGVITSYNNRYVFVRYGAGRTSAATRRQDLEWSNRRPEDRAVSMMMRHGHVIQIDFCELPKPSF